MRVVKGNGVWSSLEGFCRMNNYTNSLVVIDDNLQQIFGKYLDECFPLNKTFVDGVESKKEGTDYSVDGIDLVVAVGGGTNIDQAKLFAKANQKEWVCLPTKPTAAILSNIASVPRKDSRDTVSTPQVAVVYLDHDIIENIPADLLITEYGDIMSSLTAVGDAYLANIDCGEDVRSEQLKQAYQLSKAAMEIEEIHSLEGINALYNATLGCGRIMNDYGSTRPSSGVEHAISHALDSVDSGHDRLHGVQVGFATLAGLYLQSSFPELACRMESEGVELVSPEELAYNLREQGFPVTLSEMGIDREVFATALAAARTIRPEKRYSVLDRYTDAEALECLGDAGILE